MLKACVGMDYILPFKFSINIFSRDKKVNGSDASCPE
jgi:hypothetical protein